MNSEGKHCLAEYAKDEKAFNSIQNGIAMKEAEMSKLNAELASLQIRSKMFANTNEEIPKSLAKRIEQLNAAWVDAMHERLRLKQHEAQKRMSMIRLAQRIEYLKHAQTNLEAVVKGEPVAPGWEGGVFRI